MDPLSALGLAASVVQFIRFGGSLVAKSQQIYKDGSVVGHEQILSANERLLELTSHVKSSMREIPTLRLPLTEAEAIGTICDHCVILSRELIDIVSKLRGDANHSSRRWNSFRQALKCVGSKQAIDVLERRIAECRAELNTHFVVSIRHSIGSSLEHIDKNSSSILEAIIGSRNLIMEGLEEHGEKGTPLRSDIPQQPDASVIRALIETRSSEVQVLQNLRFPSMDHRHIEIAEAHKATFRWVLDERTTQVQPWANLVQWLRYGSGLYCINGKAASGKSSLMKYIFDHEATRRHLTYWAESSHLELAGFFFWSGGALEQRSQVGLLRSLLFQALHRRPNIARHVFPDECIQSSSLQFLDHTWGLPRLKSAFRRWISYEARTSKLSFFIDGLDEFEGNHEEMADLFKEVSSSSSTNLKICVSSRPWVVFDEAFREAPGLRLQDLTAPDIKAYVRDALESHHRMKILASSQPGHAKELIHEITSKACGVFLWVKLVVKSLLSGASQP